MPELWAGTDAGKAEHHCTVIDNDATVYLTRRVPNDETELLALLGDVVELADGESVTWAVDLNAGGAALWIALLATTARSCSTSPAGPAPRLGCLPRQRKTDARTPSSSPTTARMHRDLQPLQETGGIAVDLRILTARRIDLSADRAYAINRLRSQMLEYFPALEGAFDYSVSPSALILLTGYQTPAALRRVGRNRLAAGLKNGVCTLSTAKNIADAAVTAAEAQFTVVPGRSLREDGPYPGHGGGVPRPGDRRA